MISDDNQALHCEIINSSLPSPFLVTCVYAKCTRGERVPLWDLQRSLSSTSLPWIAGGDYNIISNGTEREGGSQPDHLAMNDFNSVIHDCNLLDPGFVGHLLLGLGQVSPKG